MLTDACNIARYFITANFTLPHTRRICGCSLFDHRLFRLVHSRLCQLFLTYSPYATVNPRPITHGHLWLAFALPSFTSCKASVFSRLQRAVSVREIAFPFLQRRIRGSVSGRYSIIPLLGISVRKGREFSYLFRCFYLLPGLKPS